MSLVLLPAGAWLAVAGYEKGGRWAPLMCVGAALFLLGMPGLQGGTLASHIF